MIITYALIGMLVTAINLRGVMVLIRTGNITFSGTLTRRDWFNIGYPLFVNAVAQGCVWPLMLPTFAIQAHAMLKHGPPTIRFTKEEPIEMPSRETFHVQHHRVWGVVAAAMNEAFKDDDEIQALCVAETLTALAWHQVHCEFKEQRRSRDHAVTYFTDTARKIAKESTL